MQPSYVKGRLYNLGENNLQRPKKVMTGYIRLGSAMVNVLYDPSATHSFISAKIVGELKMSKNPTARPLLIQTPIGEIKADHVCSKVRLGINGEEFTATLIVLESMGVPVVLGNGWLCAHKGLILKDRSAIFLTTPSGKEIKYPEYQSVPEIEEVHLEDAIINNKIWANNLEEPTSMKEANIEDNQIYEDYPVRILETS